MMNPLWIEFPNIPWGSIGWRMGFGEQYWGQWQPWYLSLSIEQKSDYKTKWPEPEEWIGLYEYIEYGTMPPWWIEQQKSLEQAAIPPDPSEEIITEKDRCRWLITRYFKRPPVSIRSRDEEFESLHCDPQGYVWGLVQPPMKDGQFIPPFIKRCHGYLIGADNLEVKQPII